MRITKCSRGLFKLSLSSIILVLLFGCPSVEVVDGPNQTTKRIVIEVDWTTPEPPPPAVLQAAKNIMQSACSYGTVVEFRLDKGVPEQGHGTWDIFDCRKFVFLNKKNKDTFYMLWALGVHADSPTIGGKSWNRRDFAVFPQVYGNNTQALQCTIVHEWLHCVGLVDKYLKMQTHHKHPVGHHCSTLGCIMFPVGGLNLCGYCRADLAAGELK